MDRIRKALDLARMERAREQETFSAAVTEISAAAAAHGPPTAIAYTRTRVFAPSTSLLEANRIINPASANPAAVAFRMLRTQVLQRMASNGWGLFPPFRPWGDQ